jgi:hypothetical protein
MRVITKKGDIFSIKIDENHKKFIQYIANDTTQLNSDVIRVFKKKYLSNDNPNLDEIVNDDIDFYAHCVVNLGVKLGLWEKIGKNENIGDLKTILFRGTKDYGHKVGEIPIRVSNNWHIWKINDSGFTKVGKLLDVYKKADIGIIVTPFDILERVKSGKYYFFYPEYE